MAERVPPTPLPRDGPKPELEAKPEPINPETAIILYGHETYIVQFPKDQIFYVPPPGNAHLVKFYHTQRGQKKKSPSPSGFWWFIGITLTVAVLLLIGAILIFHLIFSPGPPTFAVERLAVKTLHNLKLEYKISLKATNASARMGITYESGGKAVLSSHRKDIATGEPPAYKLPDRDAAALNLVLHGSKHVLPTEVKRSLDGSKDVISLSLSVKLPMTTNVGTLSWTKNMAVECKVRATALAKTARVVWQQCETKLQ